MTATQNQPTARDIIARVARQHRLTTADIVGSSRLLPIVEARCDAIAAVRQERPMLTMGQLGRIFGRDPKTILHALQKRGLR